MRSIGTRRWRVVVIMLAGNGAFVVADAIGKGGGAAIVQAVWTVAVAVGFYVWSGRDSDFAAMLIGGLPDERQALIRTRARALGGTAMYAAAVIGTVAVLALRGPGHWDSYWPFGLIVLAGTVSYGWGGRGDGFGVLIGGPADERQALIGTQARALSFTVMGAIAVTGVVVEVALHGPAAWPYFWPFLLVALTGANIYQTGLRRYGARSEADELTERAPEPMYNWWGGRRRVKPTA